MSFPLFPCDTLCFQSLTPVHTPQLHCRPAESPSRGVELGDADRNCALPGHQSEANSAPPALPPRASVLWRGAAAAGATRGARGHCQHHLPALPTPWLPGREVCCLGLGQEALWWQEQVPKGECVCCCKLQVYTTVWTFCATFSCSLITVLSTRTFNTKLT